MKILPVLIIAIGQLCTFSASAQRNNFLYIQTDNKQPFYVKANGKVHSSTRAGYLVIPQLKDTTYSLQVGFPKNDQPEHSFQYEVHGKDQGFVLKNFGGNDWGLFNLQTLQVLKPVNVDAVAVAGQEIVQQSETRIKEKEEEKEAVTDVNSMNEADDSGAQQQAVAAEKARNAANTQQELSMQRSNASSKDTIPPSNTIIKGNAFIDRLALVVDDASIRIKPTLATPKANPANVTKSTTATNTAAVTKTDKNIPNPIVTGAESGIVNTTKPTVSKDLKPANQEVVLEGRKDNVTTNQQSVAGKQPQEAIGKTKFLQSIVVQKSMTELADGFMGIFVDEFSNGKKDTIRVYVSKAVLKPVKGEVPAAPLDNTHLGVDSAFGSVEIVESQSDHLEQIDGDLSIDSAVMVIVDSAVVGEVVTVANSEKANVTDKKHATKPTKTTVTATVTVQQPVKRTDVKFLDFEINKSDSTKVANVDSAKVNKVNNVIPEADKVVMDSATSNNERVSDSVAPVKTVPPNTTDETQIATEEQFRELRRMMAAEDTEENMCLVAQKYFIGKKFATSQVKLLASLFLKEGGLYKFLDTSYPYIMDKAAFKDLRSLLKDPYYINRFKALVSE